MITINATGDTTLHTAGKYCAEDILVKVPAGGSGSGGASVETCSLDVHVGAGSYPTYTYTAYENGEIVAKSARADSDLFQLYDVVCGSAFYLNNNYNMNGIMTTNMLLISDFGTYGMAFQAPLTADTFGYIEIYDND